MAEVTESPIEHAQKPQWVSLKTLVESLPTESVGRKWIEGFVPDLSQRFRPTTIFDASVRWLWDEGQQMAIPSRLFKELNRNDIRTMRGVLFLTRQKLASLSHQDLLLDQMQFYLSDRLLVLPQAKLLDAIFYTRNEYSKKSQSSAAGENECKIQTENILRENLSLDQNDQRLTRSELSILKLRYGLEDGILRTFKEVGNTLSTGEQKAAQQHGDAIDKLRKMIGIKNNVYEHIIRDRKTRGKRRFTL